LSEFRAQPAVAADNRTLPRAFAAARLIGCSSRGGHRSRSGYGHFVADFRHDNALGNAAMAAMIGRRASIFRPAGAAGIGPGVEGSTFLPQVHGRNTASRLNESIRRTD